MANYDGSIRIDTQLNTVSFNKSSKNLVAGMEKLGNSLNKIIGSIGFGLGIAGLVKLGKQAIETASDIDEVQNVVDTAFGSMSYKIEQFSDTAVKQFGISRLSAKQTGSTFMAMGRSMVGSMETASDMAIALTGRAADMASFYNKTFEETSTALKAIYTGETEALKSYGVVMTEVNLQEYAYQKGITKKLSAMTQAEKVQLRYNYVMEQTNLAAGDFAKTSDSWANQTRILSEQFKELLGVIGSGLIATLTPVIKFLNTILTQLIAIAKQAGEILSKLFGFSLPTVESAELATDLLDAAGGAEELTDGIEEAGEAANKALSPFDKLNVLSKESGESASGAGIDIGAMGAIEDLDFEKIEEGEAAIGELEKALSSIWSIFRQAWDNDGSRVIESAKLLFESILETLGSIKDKFQEVFTSANGLELVESILDRLQSVLDIIRSISDAFSTAWNDGSGLENVTALFNMLTKINELKTAIGNSFSKVFSSGIGVEIWNNLLGIVTGVYNTIGNISEQLTIAWNTAGIGDGIWSGILGIINIISETIHNIVDSTAEWASKLDFVPLLESVEKLFQSLEPLSENIGSGLEWFWNNVLLPIAGWVIQDAVPTFLDMLSAAISVVNEVIDSLKPLGTWLWENFLQPLGEWVGDAFIGAFEIITDLLEKFGNWISEHQEAVQAFAITLGVLFSVDMAAKILSAAISLGEYIINAGGVAAVLKTVTANLKTNTVAWASNLAAKIADKAETLAIIALYAKDFIVNLAKGTAELVKQAAQFALNTAAKIADTAAQVAMTAATAAWNAVCTIATTLTTALGAAIGFLTSPIGLVIIAIGAIIAIGVLLYKNWDTIKEKAGQLKDWLLEKWEAIKSGITAAINKVKEVVSSVWDAIKEKTANIWDGIKNAISTVINGVKNTISSVLSAIKSGWDNAWKGMKDTVVNIFNAIWSSIKNVINSIIGGVEGMANGVISGINFMIRALNKIHFDIPSWVPGLGGKSFGFNLSEISSVSIPRLADGAVIRGGDPFMAVLGDQPHGQTNIETPLPTMVKAFKQALSETGADGGGEYTFVAQLDGKTIFEETVKQDRMYRKTKGRSGFAY